MSQGLRFVMPNRHNVAEVVGHKAQKLVEDYDMEPRLKRKDPEV